MPIDLRKESDLVIGERHDEEQSRVPFRIFYHPERLQHDCISGKTSGKRVADRQSPDAIDVHRNHHDNWIEVQEARCKMNPCDRQKTLSAKFETIPFERRPPNNYYL